MAATEGRGEGDKSHNLDRIMQHFLNKVAQIVVQSRQTSQGEKSQKPNTWFNLEMPDLERVKDDVRAWRADITRPMNIEIALDLSQLGSSRVIVLNDNRTVFAGDAHSGGQKHIVIEQWHLSLDPTQGVSKFLEPVVVYKRLIILTRSVYAYVRMLPGYRLYRKCRTASMAPLRLVYRITSSPLSTQSLSDGAIGSMGLGTIDTPRGRIGLSVVYRQGVDVRIAEADHLLSSRLVEDYFDSPSDSRAEFGAAPVLQQQPLSLGKRDAHIATAADDRAATERRYPSQTMAAQPTHAPPAQTAPFPARAEFPYAAAGPLGSFGARLGTSPHDSAEYVSLTREQARPTVATASHAPAVDGGRSPLEAVSRAPVESKRPVEGPFGDLSRIPAMYAAAATGAPSAPIAAPVSAPFGGEEEAHRPTVARSFSRPIGIPTSSVSPARGAEHSSSHGLYADDPRYLGTSAGGAVGSYGGGAYIPPSPATSSFGGASSLPSALAAKLMSTSATPPFFLPAMDYGSTPPRSGVFAQPVHQGSAVSVPVRTVEGFGIPATAAEPAHTTSQLTGSGLGSASAGTVPAHAVSAPTHSPISDSNFMTRYLGGTASGSPGSTPMASTQRRASLPRTDGVRPPNVTPFKNMGGSTSTSSLHGESNLTSRTPSVQSLASATQSPMVQHRVPHAPAPASGAAAGHGFSLLSRQYAAGGESFGSAGNLPKAMAGVGAPQRKNEAPGLNVGLGSTSPVDDDIAAFIASCQNAPQLTPFQSMGGRAPFAAPSAPQAQAAYPQPVRPTTVGFSGLYDVAASTAGAASSQSMLDSELGRFRQARNEFDLLTREVNDSMAFSHGPLDPTRQSSTFR